MAPVSEEHGEVAANINYAFKDYSRRRGAGRVGVEIGYVLSRSPDTVRAPDVSINLAPRRDGEVRRSGFVPGAPDIAIEIVLPGATASELAQKIGEYLAAGLSKGMGGLYIRPPRYGSPPQRQRRNLQRGRRHPRRRTVARLLPAVNGKYSRK